MHQLNGEELLKRLKESRVVLYGAGAIGKVMKETLDDLGVRVDFIVDKKYEEIRYVGDVPVVATDLLEKANTEEYTVIICVANNIVLAYKSEIEELLQQKCPRAAVIGDGRNLAFFLRSNSCDKRLQAGEEFDLIKCINCGSEQRGCDICKRYLMQQNGNEALYELHKERKFEYYFGYVLGQYCTLRCKHCNEMIPYQNNREFVSLEEVLRDCKKLIGSCYFLPFMELVGGEPFLYPQLEELLQELLQIPNLGYIKIFTNGTVVPSDSLCDILKNKRIVINLSDYTMAVTGQLLDNIYATQDKLKAKGIPYISSSARTWLTFDFENRGKSEEELKKGFAACNSADCQRLHKGVLYRCHHQYAGMRLGTCPEAEDDIIRIHECSTEELREACDYLERKEFVDACRYCNWPFDAQQVPAAEQV